MGKNKLTIRAELLYDGLGCSKDNTIIVRDGKVDEIGASKTTADYTGIVTPAFIDPHSHIGMERQAEPLAESEVDEKQAPFCPTVCPLDSIYFDDRAFAEAVDFGVLYSCVVPGSGNIMGGRAVVIRNFARNRKAAMVRDAGFKLALGYNPRSVTGWKGGRPHTRMGAAAMLRAYFSEVMATEEKARIQRDRDLYTLGKESPAQATLIRRAYELSLTEEQWAVYRFLQGEKPAKVHVHKADDALFLADLKRTYPLRVSAEHCCDIFETEIFNELADLNIPVAYGPLGALDYKTELKNASYRHVKALMDSRARFGLMTDHPVIMANHLRLSLTYFLIQGMPPAEAIGLITRENARLCGIDDTLGTVAPGKLASLIVWNKDPLHLGAHPLAVIAEGEVIRDNRRREA
ncbi:MAG TPA: amidohydrolase [Desulfobacteraceae bacterium]|nr:amidohydrolase [Desulfobacteraceae bacterium]